MLIKLRSYYIIDILVIFELGSLNGLSCFGECLIMALWF